MIGLFFIGIFLTIMGLGIGYHIGSKKIKEKEKKDTDPDEWIKGYNKWRERNDME